MICDSSAKTLRSSEWSWVLGFLCVMAVFVFIARCKTLICSEDLAVTPPPTHPMCHVVIEGAVSKPGTFLVPPGTPLRKVLKKSGVQARSNLRKIDPNQIVETSLHLHIDELSELQVVVELDEGVIHLTVPVGTRVCDLKSRDVCPLEEAKKIFKSRRVLKDGEKIDAKHIQNI